MKQKLIILIISLFLQNFLGAQNFIRLADLTGIDPTTEELSRVEKAIKEVTDIMPVQDRPLFKVYDVGFYIYDQNVASSWEDMKTKVENDPNSDYYLIFGRESTNDGLNTKIRVKLKLPNSQIYNCLTQEERDNLEKYIQKIANDKKSYRYADFEVPAIELLKEYVFKVVTCNCKTDTPECQKFSGFSYLDIQLGGLGFRKKEIKLGSNSTWASGNQGIYDYVGKKVIIDGTEYDIADQVSEGKAIIEAQQQIMPDTIIETSVTGKVYILDNESFTNGEWENAKNQALTNDFVEYWVILTGSNGKTYLYSRFTIGSALVPVAAKGENTGNRSGVVVPTPFSIALNTLGNAAIDALIQTIGLRIFDLDARSQPTELDRWLKAWSKIDKLAAAWEGISSLIPWKNVAGSELKGAILRAAMSGIAVVIDRATSPNYPNYSVKDGIVDFTITFGASSLTQIIAQKFNLSSSPRLIAEGLDNWYFALSKGPLRKIVFHASKFYDDFKGGVVHAGKYWENNVLIQGIKKIDLMGGLKSQIGGDFINIDFSQSIQRGIRGDATALSQFIPENSIDEIICNNPFLGTGAGLNAETYFKEIAKIIKSGGKVIISGQTQNKYFNGVNQALASKYGFTIETFQGTLLQQFQSLKFYTSNGVNQITNSTMFSTVLIKQ